nr:hypothetical protein [Tanacetum cinerariifolium]
MFQGLRIEDPLHHIKHYGSIVDNIQADRATRDISRLHFFHFSLKGKAETPRPLEIGSFDSNKRSTNLSKAPRFILELGPASPPSWNTQMAPGIALSR